MSKDVAIDPDFAAVLVARDSGRRSAAQPTAEAILAAAEQQFFEFGYHATRVSEVARVAEVSIGSIYVHFKNKEGLYAALIERALEIEAEYLAAVFESETLSDVEKVVALGEAYLQFFRENPGHFRLLMMPAEAIPEEVSSTPLARRVAARGAAQRERLASLIESCVRQGAMRDDVDAARAANFWWAAWNGVIALTLRSDGLAIDDSEMEQVVAVGRTMIAEGLASTRLRGPDGRLLPEFRERLTGGPPTAAR